MSTELSTGNLVISGNAHKNVAVLSVVFVACMYFVPWVLHAQTVLYESYEQGGTIEGEGTANYRLVGSFTASESMYFDDTNGSSFAGLYFNGNGCPANTYRPNVHIASSTSSTVSTTLWGLVDVDNYIAENSGAFYDFSTARGSGAGNTFWAQAGHTYGIYVSDVDCVSVVSDNLDLIYYGYLSWDGDYTDFLVNSGLTRIVSVVPANEETVATSTSFTLSSNVYVNEMDFSDDLFVRFKYIRQENLQVAVANTEVLYEVLEQPVLSYGFSTVTATSSILDTGEYLYWVELRRPSLANSLLGWFNLSNIYDPGLINQSKTNFIVVERTNLDQFIYDMATSTQALLSDPGVFNDIQDNCNPISGFDALGCLTALFIPNQTQLTYAISNLQNQVLTKAPVGYVSRVVTILNDSATTTLPAISYTFGGTALEGETIGFDFETIVSESTEILTTEWVSDQEEPQTIWDIFMPLWELLVYAFLIIMVLNEVVGLYGHHSKKSL